MVEIEIGVLRGQCLDRRIGEHDVLVAEIAAWQKQRNTSGARIKRRFTTQKARTKLARAYPDIAGSKAIGAGSARPVPTRQNQCAEVLALLQELAHRRRRRME